MAIPSSCFYKKKMNDNSLCNQITDYGNTIPELDEIKDSTGRSCCNQRKRMEENFVYSPVRKKEEINKVNIVININR